MQRYDRLQLAVVGAGILALLCTFLPYYGLSAPGLLDGGSLSATVTAWHSYAIVGCLLLLAATVLAAVRTFAPATLPGDLPVGPYLLTSVLAGLGTILVILRAATWRHVDLPGVSFGPRWGAYLLFLFAAAFTALAVVAMRAAGESMPRPAPRQATPPAA
jgi:hypothetical protein